MTPLEAVFRALNERDARYVLVGGLAVVLQGHLRATGDVDLIVDLCRPVVLYASSPWCSTART